jgi:hypothetical protein
MSLMSLGHSAQEMGETEASAKAVMSRSQTRLTMGIRGSEGGRMSVDSEDRISSNLVWKK